MSKPRFGIIFILVCLATSITFAQSFFSKVASTPAQPRNPAMSPGDFSSFSQQQTQQTQSGITQQINKNVAAAPFPPPGTPAAPASAAQPAQQQQQQQQQQSALPANASGDANDNQGGGGYQPAPSQPANNGGSSAQQGLGIKY